MRIARTAATYALVCLGAAAGSPRAAAEDPPPAKPAAAAKAAALDDFFHGAVVGLDGTKVRLRYDFSTPEQRKDWTDFVPWQIEKERGDGVTLGDGRLSMRGNAGARHVGEWDGDLTVTCRMIPDGVKDIGSYLGSDDMVSDYASFTIAETYFHGWDKKAGGDTGMMKFGKQFALTNKGGFTGFRYLAFRRPTVDPAPGKPLSYGFGRTGEKYFLNLEDLKLDSNEPPPRLRGLVAGFYSIKSSVSVDDVVLEGVLTPRWLAAKGVALKTARPLASEGAGAAAGVDPAVTALVAAYQEGKEGALKLADLVRDASRSEADRTAVADALKKGPRKALPAVIDVLYSPDAKVRAMGIEIVRGLTGGKAYGFDPKAGEKARGAAVQRLRKDITDHPEMLEGTGG